ncbi:MAG TPA: peptidase M61 [Burkholderiaceae bacterium]|nr:peptidase M61 [Burkholderiaceae bacterium]
MRNTHAPRDPVHYRVEMPDLHTRCFHVTLTVPEPESLQRLSLPAWIPGSYLIREFARHLQSLHARQGRRSLVVVQTGKSSWEVACEPGKPLLLDYSIHAADASVRTAWLDASRGFFNPTSLCLRAEGHTQGQHALDLRAPRNRPRWSVATALAAARVDKQGFGTYVATDYDELADSPFELGTFWSGMFTACGVPHRFVVAGTTPAFDGARLLADTKKICEAAIRFWHGRSKPPHSTYVFMLNAVDNGYGGLEHRNATALICGRRDLPRLGDQKTSEGYSTLLGLISHEYFHTWNVKRLRPDEFSRYDYAQENYTRLLWFFEGFTAYYDDLLLLRAGLIDVNAYFALLTKTLRQVLATPGRHVQSVAQASFDAWIRYYRPDANTPNSTVSYYTKGALVALCFDLTLRAEGKTTLDAVMRSLWRRCKGGPMRESDFAAELEHLGGRSFAGEIASWVHGTGELPLRRLLEHHGIDWKEENAPLAQTLGLKVSETASGVVVDTVFQGGAAEQAGMAAGDEWLAVESGPPDQPQTWRIVKLDDVTLYRSAAAPLIAWVSRDRRILRLALSIPAATCQRISLGMPAGGADKSGWPRR